MLPASAAGKPIEIWFQDEARVGQKGSLEYIWAPVGSRPPMVRDNRHDSVYLFGAICHARGAGAAIIMPTVNTEAMNEHLKEISTQVAPRVHAVLVCDGAGWHQQGKRLRTPHNITLLRLPPYSPELNPMENIWDYLRGNKISRLVWDGYEPKSGSCFLIQAPICDGSQPAVGIQAGFNRIGGSSLRPLRKYRSASLRIRYHRCSESNCSAVFRSSARKPAMRT